MVFDLRSQFSAWRKPSQFVCPFLYHIVKGDWIWEVIYVFTSKCYFAINTTRVPGPFVWLLGKTKNIKNHSLRRPRNYRRIHGQKWKISQSDWEKMLNIVLVLWFASPARRPVVLGLAMDDHVPLLHLSVNSFRPYCTIAEQPNQQHIHDRDGKDCTSNLHFQLFQAAGRRTWEVKILKDHKLTVCYCWFVTICYLVCNGNRLCQPCPVKPVFILCTICPAVYVVTPI